VTQQGFEIPLKNLTEYKNVPEGPVGQLLTLYIETACFVTQQGSENFRESLRRTQKCFRDLHRDALLIVNACSLLHGAARFVNRPLQNIEESSIFIGNRSSLLSSKKLAS
jgi:hypothetical protein